MKFYTLIVLFGIMNIPQQYNDRRVIVITATENNSEVKNQIESLKKNEKELLERRLAIFTQINGELNPVFNTSEQSEKFLKKNSKNYKEASTPKIHLIGLDKSIKETFTSFVKPQQIFEIVDTMPLRQAEIRND